MVVRITFYFIVIRKSTDNYAKISVDIIFGHECQSMQAFYSQFEILTICEILINRRPSRVLLDSFCNNAVSRILKCDNLTDSKPIDM